MKQLPESFLHELEQLAAAYLTETDPIRQSGFGGGPARWRTEREPILEAVNASGTFLDLGCANGCLLESLVELQHIGSTAIPGLAAKPIIDVLMGVLSLSALDEETPTLEAIGYEAMGEYGIPTRRYFRKNDSSGIRTHQVHAFEAASPHIERHLAFRDYLIAHPWVARDYGELKQRLAAQHPDDIEAYMDGKEAFVNAHEALALAWRSSQ